MNRGFDEPVFDSLLLAAGSGQRMSEATGGKNKVLLELGGAPLFIHSLRKLARFPSLRKIVLVYRSGEEEIIRTCVEKESLGREFEFVEGGRERFESVDRGLNLLSGDSPDYVLIHDSARPFLTDSMIAASIREVQKHGACTVATPLSDTLKRSDGEMLVETLPRESLYRIQTPQTFDFKLLLAAHEEFRRNPTPGITDDCMLLEQKGYRIGLVLGNETNIKVTTPFDLKLAELIYWETLEDK
ncbi:MAG: 2-C-methyl-D-erythritol 4-phosphate cytidylyltransferase [Candidatus Omnitrophica bacterium]|nr:2-C-methyl-D-erythritol 4-phosphate cytidylyltransferase [Candidatus Omnitrophota bacterium]